MPAPALLKLRKVESHPLRSPTAGTICMLSLYILLITIKVYRHCWSLPFQVLPAIYNPITYLLGVSRQVWGSLLQPDADQMLCTYSPQTEPHRQDPQVHPRTPTSLMCSTTKVTASSPASTMHTTLLLQAHFLAPANIHTTTLLRGNTTMFVCFEGFTWDKLSSHSCIQTRFGTSMPHFELMKIQGDSFCILISWAT